jgi:DHA3 family macrolide efflux protein-like MFS transporter
MTASSPAPAPSDPAVAAPAADASPDPATTAPAAEASAPPARLFNRDFTLLWQGQLVSQLGTQASTIAMMYWSMQATGSATLLGMLGLAGALPAVLLGPVAGTAADRHSRRGIIVLSDVVRGLAVLAVAAAMFLRPNATTLVVGVLFAVALLSGIVGSVFRPAIGAAIPDLVPPSRVAAANSLRHVSVQGSGFVGQAVGGVLFSLLGAPLLFFVDGVSFLFSAGSEMFIRIPQRLPERTRSWREALAVYRADTLAGLRYVWSRSGMRAFVITASGFNFLIVPVFVLLPFYVSGQLGRHADWYGFLLSALSAGAMVGLLLAGTLRLEGRRRSAVLSAALVGAALLTALLGLVRLPLLALVVCFLMGIGVGMVNVFVITLLQISTPGEMRGRVMGLAMALSQAAMPLGMALGGIAGDLTGKDVGLLFGVCGGAAAVLSLGAATRPAFRRFLAGEEA